MKVIIEIFKNVFAFAAILFLCYIYHSDMMCITQPITYFLLSAALFYVLPMKVNAAAGKDQSFWRTADPGEFERYYEAYDDYTHSYFMPIIPIAAAALSVFFAIFAAVSEAPIFLFLSAFVPFFLFFMISDYNAGGCNKKVIELAMMVPQYNQSKRFTLAIQTKINPQRVNVYDIRAHLIPLEPMKDFGDSLIEILPVTIHITETQSRRNGSNRTENRSHEKNMLALQFSASFRMSSNNADYQKAGIKLRQLMESEIQAILSTMCEPPQYLLNSVSDEPKYSPFQNLSRESYSINRITRRGYNFYYTTQNDYFIWSLILMPGDDPLDCIEVGMFDSVVDRIFEVFDHCDNILDLNQLM